MDELTPLQAFEAMLSKFELAMTGHARANVFQCFWVDDILMQLLSRPQLPIVLESSYEVIMIEGTADASAVAILMESFGAGFLGWHREYVAVTPKMLPRMQASFEQAMPDFARSKVDRPWLVKDIGDEHFSAIILQTSLDGTAAQPSIRLEFSGGYVTGIGEPSLLVTFLIEA